MDPATGSTEPTPAAGEVAQTAAPAVTEQPGFGSRGRARRRARFLRRARELAYRDLGGLVYNLHRFGQRNDALVLAKLATLGHIDEELRAIETSLRERQPVTVLREAGITACPRCAAIHSSEDRFCPNCGLPMTPHADLPIAGAPAAGEQRAPAAGAASPPRAPVVAQPTQAFAAPGAGAPVQPFAAPGAAAQPAQASPTPSATAQPTQPSPTPSATAQPTQPVAAPGATLQPTQSFAAPGATGGDPAPAPPTPDAGDPADATPAPHLGRSPTPPRSPSTDDPPAPSAEEEATEIIRPQAPSS